jgi:hypothetical protein
MEADELLKKIIVEIPLYTDFLEAGIDFLNIAWSSILEMYLELEELIETIKEEKFSDNFHEEVNPYVGVTYIRCSDTKVFLPNEVKKLREDLINSLDFSDLKTKYWKNKAAQRKLATSITIVQQGIELL